MFTTRTLNDAERERINEAIVLSNVQFFMLEEDLNLSMRQINTLAIAGKNWKDEFIRIKNQLINKAHQQPVGPDESIPALLAKSIQSELHFRYIEVNLFTKIRALIVCKVKETIHQDNDSLLTNDLSHNLMDHIKIIISKRINQVKGQLKSKEVDMPILDSSELPFYIMAEIQTWLKIRNTLKASSGKSLSFSSPSTQDTKQPHTVKGMFANSITKLITNPNNPLLSTRSNDLNRITNPMSPK